MDKPVDNCIDPLGAAAILTDTQFRISFLPRDQTERVVAMQFQARAAKLDQMQASMRLGEVCVQLKAGFGAERTIMLSGPEIMILMDALDRFVTELPAAQQAQAVPGE